MRNKKNNGFTLVELIVVLVILAILAAILVPALLGYIDRAKNQQIVLNARSCLTAAQAEFSQFYAKGKTYGGGKNTAIGDTDEAKRIMDTADVPNCTWLQVGCDEKMELNKRAGYKITFVYYVEGDQQLYFDGKTWIETDSYPDIGHSKYVYTIYPETE
jgi:prepilin-type N-terminal cleavage/methylation domain-containing protein